MTKIKIWGFGGSTFVRTVRMLLAEKGFSDYEHSSVNLALNDQKSAEHLERHPFGRVPVVDVDGFRMIETHAITRYLDAILLGARLTPENPRDAARMDMAIGVMNSYGYDAMVYRVAGYHLFPGATGGTDTARHQSGIADAHRIIAWLMHNKGDSPYLAGDALSIADLYVAPVFGYVAMTPNKDEFLEKHAGFRDWWEKVSSRESFVATPFGMI